MYKKIFKNILDRLISALMIILTIPLMFIVALMILSTDGNPIIYRSQRIGMNGKIFIMYKFRTMKVNAPDIRNEDGSTFNSTNDSRLIGIGAFLRKSSLDELPQLFNVLKGDMSVIGPRPDLPDAINHYTSNESRKLEVRPGITGYSQAYYRNSVTQEEKFVNDVFYVDNLTFILDLKVFFVTIYTVLFQKNINYSRKD